MKYKIAHKDSIGGNGLNTMEVDGVSIRIRGFGRFKFFIHKAWNQSVESEYTVSEFTTGAEVGSGRDETAAKQVALDNLRKAGVPGFQKMLDTLLNKLGKHVNP